MFKESQVMPLNMFQKTFDIERESRSRQKKNEKIN